MPDTAPACLLGGDWRLYTPYQAIFSTATLVKPSTCVMAYLKSWPPFWASE